ncbi:MAG: hypothetical protein KC466_02905 [Myxococcales bacterium]|nr:hypothetical protein [Myxococcales bacterium]
MAKPRPKPKTKPKRPKPTKRAKGRRERRRGAWLVDGLLLIVCATAIAYFTPRSWRALRVAFDSFEDVAIQAPADLGAKGLGEGRSARVHGVPDYGNLVRGDPGTVYFRMAELPKGLIVRAASLPVPDTLEDLLAPRDFSGPTGRIASMPDGKAVADRFLAQHRIRLDPRTVCIFAGERVPFPYAEVLLNVIAIIGLLTLIERRFGA